MTAGVERPRRRRVRRPGPLVLGSSGLRPVPRFDAQLVLSATATWGIGDRAAFDTVLELTTGSVALVVESADQVPAEYRASERVSVHALPGLLSRGDRARRSALLDLQRLLKEAAHCTVLPTEDHAPDRDQPARLAALARAAALLGVDTRVIGFAWPQAATGRTVRAVRAAVRAGVAFFVYDDLDRIRAMNDGVAGLRPAIDLRLAGSAQDESVLDRLGVEDAALAIVDASAAVLRGADATADLVGVVARLRRRGVRVLLMPQDTGPGGDDRALCQLVADALGSDEVRILHHVLRPAEVRGLLGRARLVVTGRPALAALAASSGVAVVGVAVDRALPELLKLTGGADRCVQPRRGFSASVGRLIDRVLDGQAAPAVRAAAVPGLSALARASLDGLPLIDPGLTTPRRTA